MSDQFRGRLPVLSHCQHNVHQTRVQHISEDSFFNKEDSFFWSSLTLELSVWTKKVYKPRRLFLSELYFAYVWKAASWFQLVFDASQLLTGNCCCSLAKNSDNLPWSVDSWKRHQSHLPCQYVQRINVHVIYMYEGKKSVQVHFLPSSPYPRNPTEEMNARPHVLQKLSF